MSAHVYSLLLLSTCALQVAVASPDEAPGSAPDAQSEAAAEDAEVIEVIDRAVPRQSPVPFSNLSRQDLQERGAFRDTPSLLSELPSIQWYSENGNGIGYNYLTIRGFDQRRISVMIDGVPQNDPEDHNVYWVNFYDLGGSLEDVQVQRGGGAALYGPPAIGGAINMVTRRFSATPYSQIQLGVGSYNSERYTGEFSSGAVGAGDLIFYGRFSHLRSDGYRDWSWSRYWRGFLGAQRTSGRSQLRLQVYGGPQRDALAYYGIPKSYNEDPELRRTNWGASTDVEVFNQTHFDLIHDWTPNDHVAVSQTLFYLRGHGYFDVAGYWGDPSYFRFDQVLSAELLALYEPTDGGDTAEESIPDDTLIRAWVGNDQLGWLPRVVVSHQRGEHIVGGELRVHRSAHWGRVQEGSFPEEVADLVVGDANHQYYAYRGARDAASVYVGERLRLGDLFVDANLQGVASRYRVYDEAWVGNSFSVPYLFLNPRVGANYNLNARLNAYVAVSRTRREPRLKNLYDADEASWGVTPAFETLADGSLDLDAPLVGPETLVDYEAGAGWEGARARARGGVFVMDFTDEIVASGGVDIYGQPRTANAARSAHTGLELEAAVALGAGFELSGNTTVSRNRFDSLGGALGGDGLAASGESAFVEYCKDDSVSQAVAVDRTGNAIAGFPDVLANSRLSWRQEGWRLAFTGRFVGRQYTDNSEDTRCDGTSAGGDRVVDPYMVAGLSAGYDVPRLGLSVSLDVNNLAGGRQLVTDPSGAVSGLSSAVLMAGFEDDYFPMAPRTTYLSVTKRW